MAPGTKREKASKLGNKKCALYARFCATASALVTRHAGLVKHAIKRTPNAMKYIHHLGAAIRSIEKLDLHGCYQGRRMMHWTVELQRIRKAAKVRKTDASKAGDAARAAPVQSSFLELDLGASLMEEWLKYLESLE